MIIFDLLTIGFYYLLSYTRYFLSDNRSENAKLHTILILWIFYGLIEYLLIEYFLGRPIINVGFVFFLSVLTAIGNYVVYIKNGRLDKVILKHKENKRIIFSILLSLLSFGSLCYLFVTLK